MIENLAIRTFVIGNLAEKGLRSEKNTMKFVWNAIANKIDQQVHFQTHYNVEDDSEGVFILENLNFMGEEWGFQAKEQIKKAEDNKQEGEGEEDKEQEAVDDKNKKKLPPVKDKKKEEEVKKKLEEEAKKKAAEEEAKRLELQRLKEEEEGKEGEGEGEAEQEKEEEKGITFKEIEIFKDQLARLGEVYVNDALDCSLTNSNTVADLRTEHKVMGIRMTEEVRKLGMFFKYEHSPTVSIIGGAFRQINVYDKLLLFNSLLR